MRSSRGGFFDTCAQGLSNRGAIRFKVAPMMTSTPYALQANEADNLPTWRAAFSERTAELMAKLALLAYEADAAVLEKSLAMGGFELLATYDVEVSQGYLARTPDFAVLVFRGSDSFADWRTNLASSAVAMSTSLGRVRVHSGFKAAYDLIGQTVLADLDSKIPKELGVYITGHSFGAAIAQIASAELERDSLAACYTFGAPRVGDMAFDSLVLCPHYRMVNGWDLVSTMPPPFLTPFRHNGDPRLMTDIGRPIMRRDRNPLIKLGQTLIGLLYLLVGNPRLFKDHKLESYLRSIAAVRELRGKDRVGGLLTRPWV
jgi:triacylglycerol lipase